MKKTLSVTKRYEEHLHKSNWMQIEIEDDVYWFFESEPRVWTVTKEVKYGSQYDRYEIRWARNAKRLQCNCDGSKHGPNCKHVKMLKIGMEHD